MCLPKKPAMAQQDWCSILGSTVAASLDLGGGFGGRGGGLRAARGDGAWTARRDADVGVDRDGGRGVDTRPWATGGLPQTSEPTPRTGFIDIGKPQRERERELLYQKPRNIVCCKNAQLIGVLSKKKIVYSSLGNACL